MSLHFTPRRRGLAASFSIKISADGGDFPRIIEIALFPFVFFFCLFLFFTFTFIDFSLLVFDKRKAGSNIDNKYLVEKWPKLWQPKKPKCYISYCYKNTEDISVERFT